MRAHFCLSLIFCSCSLLPHKKLVCTETDRCDPAVSEAFVLGQPDGNSNQNSAGLLTPVGVALGPDGSIFVADRGTYRVQAWKTTPTKNYQSVDFALGPANQSLACCGERTLIPYASMLTLSGDRLVVSSYEYARDTRNELYFFQPIPTAHTGPSSSWGLNPVPGLSTSPRIVLGPSPLIAGSRFYVSDGGNHRVLTWDTVPTMAADATGVLGQLDFATGTMNGITAGPSDRSFYGPVGSPASDGTQLAIPDSTNNRVLIFASLPTTNTDTARWALGQATFSGNSINQGQPVPDLFTLSGPQAVAMAGGKMIVADTGNHRVLLWNQPISAMAAPADIVLGQPAKTGMTPNTGGLSAARMNSPRGVATDGNRIVVSDTENHRVLVWNSWPTQTGAPADIILGQRGPDSSEPLGAVTSDSTFPSPVALAHGDGAFYVVDTNRVLVYSAPPKGPGDRPAVVLGQPDFDVNALNDPEISASSLAKPQSVSTDGGVLAVADTNNHRVLIWRSTPTRNRQPAELVLGQDVMNVAMPNNGTPARGLTSPSGVFLGGGKLYVADTGNHRVLIWNSVPAQNHQPPDVVLGQADLMGTLANRTGQQYAVTAGGLAAPTAVTADATSIYVCDTASHRVLVWKTLSPAMGQEPDVVLGQANFTSGTMPLTSFEFTLSAPSSLSVYGNRLYVAERSANRVVYFDTQNLSDGIGASGVIGQPTLYTSDPNNGGLSVERLNGPQGILAIENGLYIADTLNARIVALPPSP